MEAMDDGKGAEGDANYWIGISKLKTQLENLKAKYKTGPKGVDSALSTTKAKKKEFSDAHVIIENNVPTVCSTQFAKTILPPIPGETTKIKTVITTLFEDATSDDKFFKKLYNAELAERKKLLETDFYDNLITIL